MPDNSIIRATTEMCVFFQKESARRYSAAAWEMENGALSRVAMQQEWAAQESFEARIRLFQLVGEA